MENQAKRTRFILTITLPINDVKRDIKLEAAFYNAATQIFSVIVSNVLPPEIRPLSVQPACDLMVELSSSLALDKKNISIHEVEDEAAANSLMATWTDRKKVYPHCSWELAKRVPRPDVNEVEIARVIPSMENYPPNKFGINLRVASNVVFAFMPPEESLPEKTPKMHPCRTM